MRKKKKLLAVSAIILLFIVGLSITFLYKIYKRIVVTSPDIITIGAKVSPSPTPTPDPLAPKNILLLGYAGGDHEGATLTDTIIVAQVEPRKETVTLISIPRDLWVPIQIEPGKTEKYKINHAFAIGLDDKKFPNKPAGYRGVSGAGKLTEDIVGMVTGLKIDNFIALNFEGFNKIIDVLGSVEINVPQAFEDKYYPIKGKENDTCGKSEDEMKLLHATMSGQLLEKEFGCRFETIKFESGRITMNSETALKFVRSRHSETNGNDFARSARQQALIVGIKNKLLRLGSIPKIIPIINTASKYVLTDIDIKTAIDLFKDQPIPKNIEIKTITLSIDNVLQEALSTDRQYILSPKDAEDNWSLIHAFIKDQIEK